MYNYFLLLVYPFNLHERFGAWRMLRIGRINFQFNIKVAASKNVQLRFLNGKDLNEANKSYRVIFLAIIIV